MSPNASSKILTVPRIILASVAILVVAVLAGPRVSLEPDLKPVDLPAEPALLEKHLAEQEARFDDITPRTAKRIAWAYADKRKTDLAVVYVHGFGATRQEIAPVPELLARRIGANLFETRLRGHGRKEALGDAKASEWLQDTEEAYQVGRRLGKQVVFMAVSTGSPLVLSITHRHQGKDIAGLALFSPNFFPKDPTAGILTAPWGLQLARAISGDFYVWEPRNERQGIYWTTRHKIDALVEMMATVDHANEIDLAEIKTPVIMLYTKHNDVIDPARVEAAHEEFGSPRKKLVDLPGATMHIIAGEILAPQNVDSSVQLVADFFGDS